LAIDNLTSTLQEARIEVANITATLPQIGALIIETVIMNRRFIEKICKYRAIDNSKACKENL
jgi:hypothetical protein